MDAERVVFQRQADFTLARFRGEAIFSDAQFKGAARFAGVSFDGRARFSGGSFARDQDFAGAVFGSTADFRSRVFERGCNFGSVNFRGLADFSQTTFNGVAEFDYARFERDASFRGATFAASADPTGDRAVSMVYAVAQEELSFDAATFYKLVLAESVVARKLSFDDVSFEDPAQITLAKLNVEDLSYPLRGVDRIVDDQQRLDVLGKIETSAKNRGDIGLANDARYQLQKLTASEYGVFWHTADAVFYRGIAGYFVDPRRPLVLLLILAFAFSLLRWLSRPDSGTSRAVRPRGARVGRRVPSWLRRSWLWLVGLVTHVVDTLGHTIPHLRASENEPEERTVRRRFEVLGYRLLLVCVLIGLANSNPTLRQMFDALT
jgi:uncharacterized protein YjbI with pentapeptide repeats